MADPKHSRFYITPLSSPPSKPDAPPTQRRYHYLDFHPPAGVKQKATILLLHGFPDFSRGWRSLVSPLSMAGFRLLVPDLLGYGLSSAPRTASNTTPGGSRLAEYGGRAISIDLNGLLDHAKAGMGAQYGSNTCDRQGKHGRVIVVSHDWGGWLGWRFAQWFPQRVMGVCSLCVPFQAPTSKLITTDQVVEQLANFGYQKFFSEEKSTKIIEDHLERFFSLVFMIPGLSSGDLNEDAIERNWHLEGRLEKLLTDPKYLAIPVDQLGKCVLDEKELAHYVKTFKSRGMEGPLSWYRTRAINWEEDRALTSKTLPETLPALLLMPTEDVAVPPALGKTMKRNVPQVELVEIRGSGHFVQNELPNVVVGEVKRWIENSVLVSEEQGNMLSWIKSKL